VAYCHVHDPDGTYQLQRKGKRKPRDRGPIINYKTKAKQERLAKAVHNYTTNGPVLHDRVVREANPSAEPAPF
jgi:hypothetical protein